MNPPELLANPHLQTLLGISEWPRVARARNQGAPVRIDVPGGCLDGRYFQAIGVPSRDPAVLVLHGITGTGTDSTIVRIANKLMDRGVSALSITMRGGPGSRDCSPPLFHAGSTDDVRSALSWLLERHDHAAGIGISLGAHLLLLSLCEWGANAPKGMCGVAALSPPMDIEATSDHLAEPWGRPYQRYMVRRLIERATEAEAHLPDDVRKDIAGPTSKVDSVRTYNMLMSVPVYGYEHLDEYHARTNVACRIHQITRPVLVLQAEDDPVVPAAAVKAAMERAPSHVKAIFTGRGGHVGFIAKKRPLGDPDRRWGENRAIDFLVATLNAAP